MKTFLSIALSAISVFGIAACGRTPAVAKAQSSTVNRDGYGWYHVALRATDGTAIKLDYQSLSFGRGSFVAAPFWVTVERDNAALGSQARVIIMNDSNAQSPLVTKDLSPVSQTKFSAKIDYEFYLGYSGDSGVPYQIAVVVDGQWLKDPVSGNSNFSFMLAQ